MSRFAPKVRQLFFFFFFFHLTYSRWTSSLPSCLWSQRIFPSLPGSRLTIFYRDASSALLQLVNHWLNFTYSRSHAFRYERKNTNPTLVRIELTTSVLADVQLTNRPSGRPVTKLGFKKLSDSLAGLRYDIGCNMHMTRARCRGKDAFSTIDPTRTPPQNSDFGKYDVGFSIDRYVLIVQAKTRNARRTARHVILLLWYSSLVSMLHTYITLLSTCYNHFMPIVGIGKRGAY